MPLAVCLLEIGRILQLLLRHADEVFVLFVDTIKTPVGTSVFFNEVQNPVSNHDVSTPAAALDSSNLPMVPSVASAS